MANDLRLRVLLNAIDRVSAPLRGIQRQSIEAAKALKLTRDKLKALNDSQKQIARFQELRNGLGQTRTQLQAARLATQKLGQQMAATQTPSKALQRDFLQAQQALRRLTVQGQTETRNLRELRQRLGAAGIGTRTLATDQQRLAERIRTANRLAEEQARRLDTLTRRQRRLAEATRIYQRGQQAAGNLAAKGVAGIAGGGAALYAGARMLAPGVEFDASMSRVQAITRLDTGSEEITDLRNQARELGATTKFTGVEAANAQGFLGMAGFDPKSIKAAMPGMLNLAAAGGAELAETADIASNIMSGLGMEASQMGRLGDVLVATFTRSNTNLQMLGETMKYAAPMAKTYGVSLETAAAMAGKLGDAGMQGSMGGTALSSIMNRLAAPPKAAAKALAKLNIKTKDAKGNLRDLPTILKEIYDKTARMGTAVKGGIFKAIAGEEAVKGMAQLVNQAGIGELQKLIATLENQRDEAARTAFVMSDNLKGDLTELASAWQDLGIELEEQQDGLLRNLVKSITGIIRAVKTWARENPALSTALVKTAGIIAILIVACGTLFLAVAGLMLPFIGLRYVLALVGIQLPGLIGMLWNLGKKVLPFVGRALLILGRALLANPIIAAITAIGTAAYLLYEHWDVVGPYFESLWADIKKFFSGGTANVIQTLADFSPHRVLYRSMGKMLSYLGIELPASFTEFGVMMMDGLANGIASKLGDLQDGIIHVGKSMGGWFKETLGIQSPSRVFAELGGFTMAGLAQGIEAGAQGALAAVSKVGKQLTLAGGLVLGGTALPALAIDNRPPLSTSASATKDSHDTYEINIHATPGMDAHAVARAVREELSRVERDRGASRRSRLTDLE